MLLTGSRRCADVCLEWSVVEAWDVEVEVEGKDRGLAGEASVKEAGSAQDEAVGLNAD